MTKTKTSSGRAWLAALAGMIALGAAASKASADEGGAFASSTGGSFGAPGQIAISGDLEAHLRSGWELRIHPAADYFIIRNVSVGGGFGVTYTSGEPATTVIDLGARAGYNLSITDFVGIWPRAGLFYSHYSRHPDSSTSAFLRVDAPILVHLVPHLFVGLGPYFTQNVNASGHGYGVDTTVGGWF